MGQKTKLALVFGSGISVLVIAFSAFYFSETAPWEVPSMQARRSAKEYCSCRFVIEDSREKCEKKIFDIIPFGEIEESGSKVQMSFLWAKHIAGLESKKFGCKVIR